MMQASGKRRRLKTNGRRGSSLPGRRRRNRPRPRRRRDGPERPEGAPDLRAAAGAAGRPLSPSIRETFQAAARTAPPREGAGALLENRTDPRQKGKYEIEAPGAEVLMRHSGRERFEIECHDAATAYSFATGQGHQEAHEAEKKDQVPVEEAPVGGDQDIDRMPTLPVDEPGTLRDG